MAVQLATCGCSLFIKAQCQRPSFDSVVWVKNGDLAPRQNGVRVFADEGIKAGATQ